MKRFFIIALPSEADLQKLNKIRLFFNENGFREEITHTVNDAHITLASGTYEEITDIEKIKQLFETELKQLKPFSINYDHVTNVHKPANDEQQKEHNWIALRFYDNNLLKLSRFCEKLLEDLNLSTTRDYVEYVHTVDPSSKDESIVGDHMNMCIWCAPEKAEEAYQKCLTEVPKQIKIAKVGFRYTDENKTVRHAWEISL